MKIIFIANTPFHNYFCNKIISYFPVESEKTLITSKPISFDYRFNKIIKIRSQPLLKMYDTYCAVRLIKKNANSSKFLIPHINSLLGNFIFFNKKISFSFYYEGLLNYYKYEHNYSIKDKIQKALIARMYGYKYVFEPKIFPIEANIHEHFYSVLPNETLGEISKKVKVSWEAPLPISKNKINNLVVLGGEPSYLSLAQIETQLLMFRKTVNNKYPNYKCYYKKHPREILNAHNKYFSDFEILGWETPIENILPSINPQLIIAYPSSALINIRLMFPDIIFKVFYFDDEIKKIMNFSTIIKVYKKLGIELINLSTINNN